MMRGVFVLSALCAQAAGIHLSNGAASPKWQDVKGKENARREAITAAATAKTAEGAARAASAAAETTYHATLASNELARKNLAMYEQRYAENADAGWGSHVLSERQTLVDGTAAQEANMELLSAAQGGLHDAETAAADSNTARDEAEEAMKDAVAEFASAGAVLVDSLSNLQHHHHALVAEKAAMEKASETRASDLARQLDNEIDPALRTEIEAKETERQATLASESARISGAIETNQAAMDAIENDVAGFHKKTIRIATKDENGDIKLSGGVPGNPGSCIEAAFQNKLKFAGQRQKINGAPGGCIRFHKTDKSAADDEVYQTLTNWNADGSHDCNGCTRLL